MSNWKYFIGPGTVMGLSSSETQRRIVKAYSEMAAMTQATFQRVDRSANIWIYFKTADEIKVRWRGDGVPMGIQFGNQIWIVSDRDRFQPNNPNRRLLEGVAWHETDHYFFGPNHSPDINDLSNINLLTTYPSPNETINKWHRRLGVSTRAFYPVPKSMAGSEVRRLDLELKTKKSLRDQTVLLRNAESNKDKRAALTAQIQVMNTQITVLGRELSLAAAEWRRLSNLWASVPMAA